MKTVKKRVKSPIPFLIAGTMALLYGISSRVYSIGHYFLMLFLAFISYWFCRIFWPNKDIVVELPPDTGDEAADLLIKESHDMLGKIRRANDIIPDKKLSDTIDRIETSARELINRIEERPELASQLRTFMRYYLPTTVKILEARAKLEPSGGNFVVTKESMAIRDRTERMMTMVD